MTEQEVGIKSLRTIYLLVGIAAAYPIAAAIRGEHHLSIIIAGVVAAPIAVAASWLLRKKSWMTNWWDL